MNKLNLPFLLIFIFIAQACSLLNPPRPRKLPRPSARYNQRPALNMGYAPIRKKIVVLNFFNESSYGKEDLAITATNEMKNELNRTRQFVIDNESAHIFGSSKQIFSGGGVKLATLAKKAKVAGVNLILFGRVIDARVRQKTDEIGFVRKTDSYAITKLEVRLFDVHANKEIYTGTMNGDIRDRANKFFMEQRSEKIKDRREILRYSIRVAARRFVPPLLGVASKLDWTGRVAKIIGQQIYINAGRASGVFVGDILKVLTIGTEVYDPESGALIGVTKGEVKGTLEVIDFIGVDGSIAILHSGGSVTEGDFVQLYN
ncbi:MAG: hypothetical protein N4A33_10450 [Bacteriovoracaceae bacterium]|jgi:curli biogenesis system outer membrane secretion channel CsgG|nr:hypothetical protein [Bacteriovoracaceae bacterium]